MILKCHSLYQFQISLIFNKNQNYERKSILNVFDKIAATAL